MMARLDLSQLSIAEIRERFVEPGDPVSPHLLRKLKRDRRQGVRKIHDLLQKRQERERARQARLDSLLHFERVLWKSGLERLAGVDEAGVGPLAGPVVAAAVVFPPGTEIAGVDDSKQLVPEMRAELAGRIRETASGIGIGIVDVAEIDEINIYQGALVAMRRAVEELPEPPQHLLVDARTLPDVDIPQNEFAKGDGLNFSIAAASIIAKTHRDGLMERLALEYPAYGFDRHKGYATEEHQEAIREHGPSPAHRRSFRFLDELCGKYSDRFYALQERLEESADRGELRAFEKALVDARDELSEDEHHKLRLTLNRRWNAI